MYRCCIFCAAPLGRNQAIQPFPVGRSLAFDAAKGRLWAVCGTCARWNLAPLEERWEAIERAERLFRDTRARVQRENVGLARLPDGTRLVRVGKAVPGELAAWRYGERLARRESRAMLRGAAVLVGGAVVIGGASALFAAGAMLTAGAPALAVHAYVAAVRHARNLQVVGHAEVGTRGALARVTIRRRDVDGAWLCDPGDGRGIALNFPRAVTLPGHRGDPARVHPVTVRGDAAVPLLCRAMVHVNRSGADGDAVRSALRHIGAAGSPGGFLQQVISRRLRLTGGSATDGPDEPLAFGGLFVRPSDPDPGTALALEMALHEETERRALDGELAMLQGMWREAEEIAAIADRLPDVAAPEPPRLDASR